MDSKLRNSRDGPGRPETIPGPIPGAARDDPPGERLAFEVFFLFLEPCTIYLNFTLILPCHFTLSLYPVTLPWFLPLIPALLFFCGCWPRKGKSRTLESLPLLMLFYPNFTLSLYPVTLPWFLVPNSCLVVFLWLLALKGYKQNLRI